MLQKFRFPNPRYCRRSAAPSITKASRNAPPIWLEVLAPVSRLLGSVAPHFLRRQEAELGDQQQAGIEVTRAVALDEAAEIAIETLAADVIVNFGGDGAPAIDRAVELEAFRALDRAIERDPAHDLRIGELLPARAHLPDALVGLAPALFHIV